MTGRKTLIVSLAVFSLINPFLSPAAYSRFISVTVAVDGMACPFCAYGVEKKLKKVAGVGSISIDLKSGMATLIAAVDSSIDLPGVHEAIRKSGFTPGEIQVTATGTIEKSDDEFILVTRDAQEGFTIIGGGEIIREALMLFTATGDMVKLTGAVEIGSDGGMTMNPETAEEYKK